MAFACPCPCALGDAWLLYLSFPFGFQREKKGDCQKKEDLGEHGAASGKRTGVCVCMRAARGRQESSCSLSPCEHMWENKLLPVLCVRVCIPPFKWSF